MAIIPESQYPGKVAPASAQYPYGQAQNITDPGDGTGTPWEAALVNDIFGFQQALLSAASVAPSGNSETVGASQYFEALQRLGVFLYDSTRVYREGEFVRTTVRIYKSAVAGNQGNDPDTDDGTNWAQVVEKQPTTQIFTSSGTWTKPTGCKRVKVTGIAAGGGGGGANITDANRVSAGGGGGAGGAFVVSVDVSAVASVPVTVGAGGVGNDADVGGDGGDSSFGTYGVATGGAGGRDGSATAGATAGVGAAGGQGTAGDIVFGGSGGSDGITVSTERNDGTGASGIFERVGTAGLGGGAPFSAGGGRTEGATGGTTGGAAATARSGAPASGYGGGGGGAWHSADIATGSPGGNGGGGIVIVTEYYS